MHRDQIRINLNADLNFCCKNGLRMTYITTIAYAHGQAKEGLEMGMDEEKGTKTKVGGGEDGAGKRVRSTIEFPYSDLSSAIEMARVIHDKAGIECEIAQLAAWLDQSLTGGTFRQRYSAARMFGLIKTELSSSVRLTDLGQDVLSPGISDRAKSKAFLEVELFSRLYETHKGRTLPSANALTGTMIKFGVAPKQADRARQTFIKSANYAQFIDGKTGSFIEPGFPKTDEPSPAEPMATTNNLPKKHDGVGDSSGEPPPTLDPIIKGLIDRLPKAGSVWPSEQRKLWLKILEDSFQLVFNDDETRGEDGEIKK